MYAFCGAAVYRSGGSGASKRELDEMAADLQAQRAQLDKARAELDAQRAKSDARLKVGAIQLAWLGGIFLFVTTTNWGRRPVVRQTPCVAATPHVCTV